MTEQKFQPLSGTKLSPEIITIKIQLVKESTVLIDAWSATNLLYGL